MVYEGTTLAVKRIVWILTAPLFIVLAIFLVINAHPVPVDVWIFEEEIRLSWILLATLFAGFLTGATVMWISGSKRRRLGREARFRSSHLEREVIHLKREVDRAKEAVKAVAPRVAAGAGGERTGGLPAVSTGR